MIFRSFCCYSSRLEGKHRLCIECGQLLSVVCSVIYGIWRLRNRVIFARYSIDIETVVFKICASLRTRWLGIGVRRGRKTVVIGRNIGLW